MKKRTRVIWMVVAGLVLLLLLIAGVICARIFGTRYPDAVTEADGVSMAWVEEATRENLTFRICNGSDGTIYGGNDYVVEYKFLGGWYQAVDLDGFWTYELDQWVIEGHTDHTVMQENPSKRYELLPPGKYRIVKRFHTVDDFTLYENRKEYIDLYLEFELD